MIEKFPRFPAPGNGPLLPPKDLTFEEQQFTLTSLKLEYNRFPLPLLLPLLILFLLLALLPIARSYTSCPSFVYLFLTLVPPPAICLSILLARIRAQQKLTPPSNLTTFLILPGDLTLSGKNLYIYPSLTFFSGIMAGLLGIGGGVINAPLLLHLGVDPLVVAATASTMIVLTSGTSLVSYTFFGNWLVMEGCLFFCLGFVGTYAGQILSYRLFSGGKTYGISFVMGGVVVCSVIGMTVETIVQITKGEVEEGGLC